ncbi:uncharacterized protein BO96DRAFT_471042 [Aspergillus niger CBS 101883]|uniref:Uncharacterized protein n=3 Tax=Aspergillus niger TaxID=5061 RepID=A2QE91_ASPNC|nr:uncharacterized protein BO96DRAFT_471042 [Aspergillus niger CBS 101883]XP_059600074.1 hypothetical protein An02g09840 [Aspergillus niger]PYH61712.1 hypothetical protein BO96DRAFT_471042 [Aspergillus niger CBS 101883]RDH23034.1 hypothetical protein M747DRAFT_362935 [Aspergillus niger ATCC 13496]CAK37852.1 hypothetical protein An02g09840 [Aspergillus niger]
MQNLPWMHPVCREVRVYCCGHAPLGWSNGVAWELGNGSRSSSNARNQGQEMYQIEMMTLMLMLLITGAVLGVVDPTTLDHFALPPTKSVTKEDANAEKRMMKNCTHMAPIDYGLLDSWREWKQSRCGRHLHATAHPFGDEETAHARVDHVLDPEHPEATDHFRCCRRVRGSPTRIFGMGEAQEKGTCTTTKCKAPKFGGGARVMHICFFPFPANSPTIFPPILVLVSS